MLTVAVAEKCENSLSANSLRITSEFRQSLDVKKMQRAMKRLEGKNEGKKGKK